jgi:hypothetical protein
MADRTNTPPYARFSRDFDRHVTPRLAAMVPWMASLVRWRTCSFGEALELIWREAARLGAGYLDHDTQHELRDWLMSELTCAIDAEPPAGTVTSSAALKLPESDTQGEH